MCLPLLPFVAISRISKNGRWTMRWLIFVFIWLNWMPYVFVCIFLSIKADIFRRIIACHAINCVSFGNTEAVADCNKMLPNSNYLPIRNVNVWLINVYNERIKFESDSSCSSRSSCLRLYLVIYDRLGHVIPCACTADNGLSHSHIRRNERKTKNTKQRSTATARTKTTTRIAV